MFITPEQQAAIEAYLDGHHIPAYLGTKEAACSIAAINFALSGQLTDKIPACMSEVIGRWIIAVQDAMPDKMRNSQKWRSLLPPAAGTGRQHEAERLAIILGWMWGTVLPPLQPLADKHGFGAEWRQMLKERTNAAANAASDAGAEAADASEAASEAVSQSVWAASEAAALAAEAATDAAMAKPGKAVLAAVWAANAGVAGFPAAAWQLFDPPALLEKLVTLEGGTGE